ncbi:MAG: hypothetical protein ACRD2B_09310 [Terriglobia bacterium]
MRLAVNTITLVVVSLGVMALCGCGRQVDSQANNWSPKAAAAYLDQREAWWMTWPVAARDHGTYCVSCHTVIPYALARPELRRISGATEAPVEEKKLLENVRKRVQLWNQTAPYYTDQEDGPHKADQSRGTESVLNALILASADARSGRLSDDALAAFAYMWDWQYTAGRNRGAWAWLQFDNEPFEGHDSEYYGAALAAVAVGLAPDDYGSSPGIQKNISLLREYLNAGLDRQSLINRITALWASEEVPGLLSPEKQQAIIREALRAQSADGGWSLASLSWSWRDWTAKSLTKLYVRSNESLLHPKSDGYATGFIAYVLEKSGASPNGSQLRRALAWLKRSQNATEGSWPGYSLNNRVSPSSEMGHFMSDAATGFAVLALVQSSARSAAPNVASDQGRRERTLWRALNGRAFPGSEQ